MRLPRDWLGPREELVPFGPRARSPVPGEPPSTTGGSAPSADELTADNAAPTGGEALPTAGDATPTADGLLRSDKLPSAGEPPPSAEDFWGERSAAIHGALQAPADWAPADPEPTDRRSVGARAIHLRRFDRRSVASAAAGLAAVAVTVIAVVSIFGAGEAPQPAGGSKAGVAAVMSGGVSRIFQLGLAQIDASVGHDGATVAAQSAAATARRTPHRERAAKPIHKAAHSPSTRSPRPTSVEVARTATAPASTYRPAEVGTYTATTEVRTTTPTDNAPARSVPPRTASQPLPSRATASSTGESGALGPIHSPNG